MNAVPADASMSHRASASHGATALLVVGATGVVFGDIGTSPLYALEEAFSPHYGIALTHDNVFGILSMIVWAMFWTVTVKYLALMLRADNNGEGGVLSLLALALREVKERTRLRWTVI